MVRKHVSICVITEDVAITLSSSERPSKMICLRDPTKEQTLSPAYQITPRKTEEARKQRQSDRQILHLRLFDQTILDFLVQNQANALRIFSLPLKLEWFNFILIAYEK